MSNRAEAKVVVSNSLEVSNNLTRGKIASATDNECL